MLHFIINSDEDDDVRAHAARAIAIVLPVLVRAGLQNIQTPTAWLKLSDIKDDVQKAPSVDRQIVMLSQNFERLKVWALVL